MDSHPDVLCVNEGRFFGRDYRGHGVIPRSLYGTLADSEYLKTWVKRSPWSRGEDTEPVRGRQDAAHRRDPSRFARIIHIVRDGRDVAISSMHHISNNAKDRGSPNDLKPEILAKRDAYRQDLGGFACIIATREREQER